MGAIKVVIVGEDVGLNDGLASSITKLTGIVVSGTCSTFMKLAEFSGCSSTPDILLVNGESPRMTNVRLWGIFRPSIPDIEIAVLTEGDNPAFLEFFLAMGAKVLWKAGSVDAALGRALRNGARGFYEYHPIVLERLKKSLMQFPQEDLLQVGSLTINMMSRQVSCSKRVVRLSPLEYDLLVYLAKNRGRPVGFAELMQAVWGLSEGEGRTRDQLWGCMKRLRARLKSQSNDPPHIHTIRGFGYVLHPSPLSPHNGSTI